MYPTTRRWLAAVTAASLATLACNGVDSPSAPNPTPSLAQAITIGGWTVKNLGVLSGTTTSTATAMNDAGIVVGYSGPKPFRYAHGAMAALPTLAGTVTAGATGVNNGGDIVGWSFLQSGASHGWFLSAQGALQEIVPPAGGSDVHPSAINNSGVVAGSYRNAQGLSAFKWSVSGGFVNLAIARTLESSAADISDLGNVVGYVEYSASTIRARSWSLGDLAASTSAHAEGVNSAGLIVGNVLVPGVGIRAVEWTSASTMVPLPPAAISDAHGVSELGRIVGYKQPNLNSNRSAFTLYKGVMTSLPPLVRGSYSEGIAVNRCGLVAGYSSNSTTAYQPHAVLWTKFKTPCDT